MLRPFLFVGLGGSGGKTLRAVRADVRARLHEKGIDEWPEAWQLVYIDVPTTQEVGDVELPPPLPLSDYIGLVAPGIDYRAVDSTLVQQAGGLEKLAGWRPNPDLVSVPIGQGAGQHRTIGRVITVTHLAEIRDRVRRAVDAMRMPAITGELQRITEAFGGQPQTARPDPVVFVISSLAGGSGAGSLIDVCDVVRSVGQDDWASNSGAVLYAPDVFGEIPPEARVGVQANALATMSEILAGYWNEEGHTAWTESLMQRSGIAPTGARRHGPRYPFLVGRRNNEISFKSQTDVYLAMGKALAALLTSGELQDQYVQFVSGNWSNTNKAVDDSLPLKQQGQETPFSAFGFARLSLGRDRFASYAAEWLARSAVERLLREHAPPEKAAQVAEEVLLDEAAVRAFPGFRHAVGLHETGWENNQVLDAVRPPDRAVRGERIADAYSRMVKEAVPAKGLPTGEWERRIEENTNRFYRQYIDDEHSAMIRSVSEWVETIQRQVLEKVGESVGRLGAPVTVRLLDRTIDDLDAAVTELGEEARSLRASSGQYRDELRRVLPQETSIPATHGGIAEAIRAVVHAFSLNAEAELREATIELIRDFAQNFLQPLSRALRHGFTGLLHESETSVAGQPPVVSTWPVDDYVPTRLRPWDNEFLLERVDDFRRVLEHQLIRSAPSLGGEDIRDSESRAIAEIIEGLNPVEFDREQHDPTIDAWKWLVHRRGKWVPSLSSVQVSLGGARPAQFTVGMKAEDILERAQRWVNDPEKPIGQYVATSLREYLSPDAPGVDPAQHAGRIGRFKGQLAATVQAATPLVDVDPSVLSRIHNQSSIATTTTFSGVPFDDGSPAVEALKDVLMPRSAALWDRARSSLVEGDLQFIEVFSFSTQAYEAPVFDSVVRPIGVQWNELRNSSHGRSEFWRFRRARPLPEFIPVAPGVRRAMIRGWFTAGVLGQIRQAGDRATTVYAPPQRDFAGGDVPFPYPYIGRDLHEAYDLLPTILKSLPLAMVAVNLGEQDAMRAYARLRDLGRDRRNDAGRYDAYRNLSEEFGNWIVDGSVARGAPTPDPRRAGTASGTSEERRDAALVGLRRLQEQYLELFEQVRDGRHRGADPLVAELEDDYRTCLEELIEALDASVSQTTFDAWS